MKRIAGTTFVKVDGQQLELEGKMEAPLTDTTRETKMGVAGVAGYKEMERLKYIKGTFYMRPDFPLEKLRTMTDAVVTADFANGFSYILSGAVLVGEPALDPSEGTVELEFNGTAGKWQ
ncbi:MAG: phage tail tube protein [Pseudomonadota bacterium]